MRGWPDTDTGLGVRNRLVPSRMLERIEVSALANRNLNGARTSNGHLRVSHQQKSAFWAGVIGVFGNTGSLAHNSEGAIRTRPSGQPDCRANPAPHDEDLIALCQHFRCKMREWIEQIGTLGIEGYDEDAAAGRALHQLRVEWGNALDTLRRLVPRTATGAAEKLSAAQVFLAFSCAADGSASEFLALAARELDHVTAAPQSHDRTRTSWPPSTLGPFRWLERLTRRA